VLLGDGGGCQWEDGMMVSGKEAKRRDLPRHNSNMNR